MFYQSNHQELFTCNNPPESSRVLWLLIDFDNLLIVSWKSALSYKYKKVRSRDYVYGIWQNKVLSINNYFRIKYIVREYWVWVAILCNLPQYECGSWVLSLGTRWSWVPRCWDPGILGHEAQFWQTHLICLMAQVLKNGHGTQTCVLTPSIIAIHEHPQKYEKHFLVKMWFKTSI